MFWSLVPGTELLNPWFPKWLKKKQKTKTNKQTKNLENLLFYWVDSGWAPGWETVTRKTKPWLKVWNFQPCPAQPFSKEWRRVEMELLYYLIMPMWGSLHKNPTSTGFRELPRWQTHPCTKRVMDPNSAETETPKLGTFPRPMYLFICIFYHIL